jgi:hypothetical protein
MVVGPRVGTDEFPNGTQRAMNFQKIGNSCKSLMVSNKKPKINFNGGDRIF